MRPEAVEEIGYLIPEVCEDPLAGWSVEFGPKSDLISYENGRWAFVGCLCPDGTALAGSECHDLEGRAGGFVCGVFEVGDLFGWVEKNADAVGKSALVL